eukprot:g8405.t1
MLRTWKSGKSDDEISSLKSSANADRSEAGQETEATRPLHEEKGAGGDDDAQQDEKPKQIKEPSAIASVGQGTSASAGGTSNGGGDDDITRTRLKKRPLTYTTFQNFEKGSGGALPPDEALKRLRNEVRSAFGGAESRHAIMDTRQLLQEMDQISLGLYHQATKFVRKLGDIWDNLSETESQLWKLAMFESTDYATNFESWMEKKLQKLSTKIASELDAEYVQRTFPELKPAGSGGAENNHAQEGAP